MRRHVAIALVGLLAAAGAMLADTQEAEACGGFFCNQQQPVDQSAERIIFAKNDDGTVTAVVQILYQGPAEEFAWLLPVSGAPEVGVSSNTAFQRLQRQTEPSYQLDVTVEGDCKERQMPANNASFDGADVGAADAAAGGGGVTVVDSGTVGPYNYTTISVDPEQSDPAQSALDWLTQNQYDLTDIGPDLIRDYLEGGMNLIAFKLTKTAQAGDIRPVTLEYPAELPMIPIKLTAVAAQPDMGVMVWVLGDGRAIPTNYKSLILNDAAINWFNWRSNYEDVITQAANEANGQGFVTEYAMSSSTLSNTVYNQAERDAWQKIKDPAQWDNRHGDLLFQALRNFARWDGMPLVLSETVPMPDGVSLDEFMQCVRCYYDGSETQIQGFSPAAFLTSLEQNVIDPVAKTQDILESQPYVTRMYTNLSPPEMTLDPVFDFNTALEDVSNVHRADQTIYCSPQVYRSEAPWQVTLPSGDTVDGTGRTWPLQAGEDMPAAREIRQERSSGEGETVTDNRAEIQTVIEAHNDTISTTPPAGDSGGGCQIVATSTGGNAGAAAALGLLGLGLIAVRRRRS